MRPPDLAGSFSMPLHLDRQRFKLEVMRFGIVGAANFVLTFAVFYTLVRIAQVHHLIALTVSWLVGMVFSYVLNFNWVFKPEEKLLFRARFVKFFSASLVSIGFNLVTLQLIVEYSGFDPFYVQCALIPLVVLFNFVTAKFWSLKSNH